MSKGFRFFVLFSIPMRIRTGTCYFRPMKMEKWTYFITLKDDGRIECFVTFLQIDLSSLATKRNISNTLFLGTDIYNGAATISIMHKMDKSTSRRPSNWHNNNPQWPPSFTLTWCHVTAKCLLVECKLERKLFDIVCGICNTYYCDNSLQCSNDTHLNMVV